MDPNEWNLKVVDSGFIFSWVVSTPLLKFKFGRWYTQRCQQNLSTQQMFLSYGGKFVFKLHNSGPGS
ncbi:unnamed protein product [Calypogeia fissa]